ncbi:hypothetical protein [Parabacteroides johnsonii]
MKNFIFAMCGFLMMSLVSLGVQASSVSERIPCKSELATVDVGLPDIQLITLEAVPADCVVLTVPQPVFMVADTPAVHMTITATQGKQVSVPKCPFRYVFKSKYLTHYSYTAYSKLITPC